MESLQDILGSRDFVPPTEIELIQSYIERRYKAKCRVQVKKNGIIICVRSSALAGTLRMEQQRLVEDCQITKKIIIRIG
jgi:hypothetical protein